ncbi:hypothetical protein NA56DRAFT_745613 [Hyaloscypha hepaticicola]|uniref:Uncharacterized protein n=1 Tax=Hyaloscypha hepaticicola TaxID=2082293 RepID=A0A2J6QFL4_9HELO|nr:hypothetical protein NA56DRAFT_745613 [Hyaloscypha hepaticicola]
MSRKLSAYVGLVCSAAISWKFASDTMVRKHAEHLWERLDDEGDGMEGERQRVDIIGQNLSLLSERSLFPAGGNPELPAIRNVCRPAFDTLIGWPHPHEDGIWCFPTNRVFKMQAAK